jgi:nucleotide-binding universal stress UspA family protein
MKDTKVQNILVYTDFSEVGEKSLQWAVFLAKKFKRKLQIIHVINENSYIFFSKDNVRSEVNEALSAICTKIKEDHKIESDYFVDEGCTCTIINSTAERVDAFLIVLGTHGKNDPQFLSGHAAIKIIRKARIPYFVVQKNSPAPDDSKNIIIPLDYQKEMKEKTGWVTYFAKNIKVGIDILFYENQDDRIANNIKFCTKFFDKFELQYKNREVKRSRSSINSMAVKVASEDEALCITILTTKEETIIHRIFGLPETSIISNSNGIPVLCINPKKNLYIPCI